MSHRLYILSICDLDEERLQQTAMNFLDSHRKMLVDKYKQKQDRLRAIAAGLLLQIGFLELVPQDGDAHACEQDAGDDLSPVVIQLDITEALKLLQEYAIEHLQKLPEDVSYEKGKYGKPEWQKGCIERLKPDKAYSHFNISHSGDYVVLAISDCPVGVDIQKERVCDYPGGYEAFSRMEAYVKCTGEGIAHGVSKYEACNGLVPGIAFHKINAVDQYVICLCVCSVL